MADRTEADEISALLDGDLEPARAEALFAAADRDPALRDRLAGSVRIDQRLHLAIGSAYDELRPLPPRLRDLGARLGDRLARPSQDCRSRDRSPHLAWLASAAMLLAIAVGWSAGLLARPGLSPAATYADEAREIHLAANLAPGLDSNTDSEALEAIAAAFEHRIRPPDLRRAGLVLAGLDIVPTDLGPAVLFRYIDRDGLGYSLILSFASELRGQDAGFAALPMTTSQGGLTVGAWQDEGAGYALVAGTTASRLETIARIVLAAGEPVL